MLIAKDEFILDDHQVWNLELLLRALFENTGLDSPQHVVIQSFSVLLDVIKILQLFDIAA